jgi:hypothetical protein
VINDHLTRCAGCRTEYEQLRETTGKLTAISYREPADAVLEQVWRSPYSRFARNSSLRLIIGGYATFVSKLDLEGHRDRPDWLTHVDPGTIKVKLAASLIGISSIHLLKAFVNISNVQTEHIKWQILIHLTFLGSAILLAWTDKLMQRERKH